MADRLSMKRPREDIESNPDMADRLNTKRPREENGEEPNIVAANGAISSSEVLPNLNKENQFQIQEEEEKKIQNQSQIQEEEEEEIQEEEERRVGGLSSIIGFQDLHLRELGNKRKLANIYRDYHVHTFEFMDMGSVRFIVLGDDNIILVGHSDSSIAIFRRHGDQISAVRDDHGSLLTCDDVQGTIRFICYNNHNNSFLIVTELQNPIFCPYSDNAKIMSLEMESIREGRSPNLTQLFKKESSIRKWDFDIPVCRAMIHNPKDRIFKFFELKEYKPLFTVPDLGGTFVDSPLKTLSLRQGNKEMVMYETHMSMNKSGLRQCQRIQLRIYSKLDGVLRKRMILPQDGPQRTHFVVIYGDTLLVQRYGLDMEVVDISCENPVRRNTNIQAAYEPYYLHKRSQFICYTAYGTLEVFNLQGQILVTLEDHPIIDGPSPNPASLFVDSYIPNSQDILISLCRRFANSEMRMIYSVNVSSIVTGKCLAKIASDFSGCSEIRKAALDFGVYGFGYDERTHEIFTGNQLGICGVWSNKFYNDVGDVETLRQAAEANEEEEEEEDEQF